MKKLLFPLVLLCTMICSTAQSQESLRLSFTGRIGDGYYQRMDCIGIRNVTRDWVEVIYYPDTILLVSSPENVEENETSSPIIVTPNPFNGETNVSFNIERPSHAIITTYGLSGKLYSKYESAMNTGNYSFKVCLKEPQLYILSVQIGDVRYVAKLSNLGNSSNDYIELTSSDGVIKHRHERGDVTHSFEYGDIMEFVGYATINGSTVSSERITQPQFFNEDITLHFSAYLPTVQTDIVDNILQTTATCGGEVTSDGWAFVTERGVCWNTEPNPTVANPHTNDQNGLGHFTSSITGLSPNTVYYVRAYATNNVGTAYGNEFSFRTEPESLWPDGTLPGLFSVDAIRKVQFAQGNLQYRASTNTWRFANTQYDIIGEDNVNMSSTYDGCIDLFSWGTSGYNHGAICYQPWSISNNSHNFYAYGNWIYNLNDQNGKADWGYNPIINGGNQENYWYTLSKYEWNYILFSRETPSGIRFAKAKISELSLNCFLILPDDWDESVFWLTHTNQQNAYFDSNPINIEQVNYLESYGVVLLPAAGSLAVDDFLQLTYEPPIYSNSSVRYWTSNCDDYNSSFGLIINRLYVETMDNYREAKMAVRLARVTVLNNQ